MSDRVTDLLEQLGLGQYAEAFAANAIDEHILPDLTDTDLKELGVIALGHRKAMLKAIAVFSEARSESSESPADIGRERHSLPTESDASLAAWERHPGERKPVTMLFADIAGSTALTEKLDAEESHDLLYGATQRMCGAVENNRGTVCRFMGDGVMAMFGAPVASEHHAIDACEAALEMQEVIRAYASDIEPDYGSGLQIRVGLHSGEVVVLTVGEGENLEYDASGPTVPIAARMEQASEPGEVYLTAATRALAAHRIETAELKPVSLKGISEPVAIFALGRVRSAEEARPDSTHIPFVGRRGELGQFRGMLEICLEDGHGLTVYVRGEPGIGKTRLVGEFYRIAESKGVACHRSLVLEFGVGKGQDAIRALVRSLLGIVPGSGKHERGRAADAVIDQGALGVDERVFLNDLLDLPQPTELRTLYDAMDNTTRNEGQQVVVSKLVTSKSRQHPLLTIVEDTHWADALTLTHLATIAKTVAECPALLVVTSRIEGDPLNQMWRSSTEGSPFVSIDLGPLRKQESIEIIKEFIDSNDPLAEDCLERASGNPLFLEQLLRNAQEGTNTSLPDSIQSLVLARMDRLAPDDKLALQSASVIGQRFDLDVLNHLLGENGYDAQVLVTHNLVRPDVRGYLFAHALIQEGVYSSLIKRQRIELHRKAATWFAKNDLGLYAEHLGHAGDENAPQAFIEAAREQAQQYRIERALELVSRGLDIARKSDMFALRCLQGELLRTLGSTSESIEIYRQAQAVATSDTERCHASVGMAEGLRVTGEFDEMLEQLASAEVIAKEQALATELARISLLQGNAHFFRGNQEAGLEVSIRALQQARGAGSLELEARALSNVGDAEYARGRMLSAHKQFDRCIEIGREHGFGQILSANLGMLGITFVFKNEFRAAEDSIRSSIELARDTAQLRAEMMSLGYLGYYMVEWEEEGNLAEAKALVKQQGEIAHRLGARWFKACQLVHQARISIREGHRSDAEKLSHEAIARFRDISSQSWASMAHGVLAEATDDAAQRRSSLEEGKKLLPRSLGDSYLHFYRDAMEACLRAEEWSEVGRYAQALENFTSAEPTPWSDFFIARGRALAAFGRGDRGDTTMQEIRRLRDEGDRVGLKVALPALEEALSVR